MYKLKRSDYEEALSILQSQLPRSIVLCQWLSMRRTNVALNRRVQDAELSICYANKWPNADAFFTIDYRPFADWAHYPYVAFFAKKDENCQLILDFLRALDERHQFSKENGFILASLPSDYVALLKKAFGHQQQQHHHHQQQPRVSFKIWNNLRVFWLPTNFTLQLEQAINSIVVDNRVYADTLRSGDATTVNNLWAHKFDGSIKLIRERIEKYPSVCLRKHSDHQLAAFILTDSEYGFITNLFVFPEFRRHGLATFLEMSLAKKLIKFSLLPYKHVVVDNQAALEMTAKNPLWNSCGFCSHWMQLCVQK